MSEKNFVSYGDAETLITEINKKITDNIDGPTWEDLTEDVTKNVLTKKTAGSYKSSNITYTVDDDGIVTANGTAGENINSLLTIATLKLKAGQRYWLSGCPSGGGDQTYFIICGDGSNNVRDRGNGVYFTASSAATVVQIVIAKNVTVSELQFKPMLVLDKYRNESFIPNIQSNKYLWDNTLHVPAIEGPNKAVLTKQKNGSTGWERPNGLYIPIGQLAEFMSYDYEDGNIARKCVSFRVILNTDQVFTSVSALRQYAFDNGGIPIQYGAAPMTIYGADQSFVGTPEIMGVHGNSIRIHVKHCVSTAPRNFNDNEYEIVLTDRFIKEVVDTVTLFGNNLYLHTVDCFTKTQQEYIADEGVIMSPVYGQYCMLYAKCNDAKVDNFD